MGLELGFLQMRQVTKVANNPALYRMLIACSKLSAHNLCLPILKYLALLHIDRIETVF